MANCVLFQNVVCREVTMYHDIYGYNKKASFYCRLRKALVDIAIPMTENFPESNIYNYYYIIILYYYNYYYYYKAYLIANITLH